MKSLNLSGCGQITTASALFIAWTLTSFLCHECAKMFLQNSEESLVSSNSDSENRQIVLYRFALACILTAVQCLTCILLVQTKIEQQNETNTMTMVLLGSSHILATLATNYSMTYIEAASTLAIKLTEPIIMAIAHHMIFRTMVPLQTAISIPLIICGALVFTGWNVNGGTDYIGISLAFASNIILSARNITFKKIQAGSSVNSTFILRPNLNIALIFLLEIVFIAVLYLLEVYDVVSRTSSLLALLCLASGIFHVAYSYISTCMVLKVMNVISHSIANICKRFLVVLFLCALGSRHISERNMLGLVMAVCGLLVYTYGKKQSDVPSQENNEENVTRWLPFRRMFVPAIGILILLLSFTTLASIARSTFCQMSNQMDHNKPDNTIIENQSMDKFEIQQGHISNIERITKLEMQEFISWRLIDHPEETDRIAKTLTRNENVIEEAQRILMNLLNDLLGKAKHVMLIEIATYENKGDPAISVGEVMLLRRMNINIVFYCETSTCTNKENVDKAVEINKKYYRDELVILMQGGGNMVGYSAVDSVRKKFIDIFPDRKIIIFSQSIWLNSKNAADLEYCRHIYSNRSNLVIFLRDRQSLEIAKTNFKGTKLILAPDMAFCIGIVPRQMAPIYDIVWLKRNDDESSNYIIPSFPSNMSVDVRDWVEWKSNPGRTYMETSFLIAAAGFQFLQRGRIVITDRLHGHILSTLMNIPHVLIDNPPYFKLSSFDKSWTMSLSNTILVTSGSQALDAARELLKRYHHSLPLVGSIHAHDVSKLEEMQAHIEKF